MNEQLIILAGTAPDAEVAWLPADLSGQPLGTVQRGALTTAAAMAGDRRVVVFLPAELLILTDVTVPGLRGPRLRQAVPFALEDRVATDIEALHFAFGRPDAEGRIEVAAIARELLDAWLAALRGAGIRPAALVPDCLGLPWTHGASIALVGNRALLRDGPAAGFAGEIEMLEPMLDARKQALPDTVAMTDGAVVPVTLAGVPQTRLVDGLLPWLAPQAAEPALNLLQGEYAPRERRRIEFGRWRLPAALAAGWVLLALVAWTANFVVVSAEHRALRAEVAATFGRILPGEPFVDPRLQIERRLSGGAGGGAFLGLLDAAGTGLAGTSGVQLGALSYRGNTLELTVTAQRAEQLDQLRDRLASGSRYEVSIESASSRGGQVEGRIQLRGTAGR